MIHVVSDNTRPDLVEVLDTTAAEPGERFNVWSDLVQMTCGPLRISCGTDADFHGSIVKAQLAPLEMLLVQAAPHAVERTGRLVKRSEDAQIYLCTMLEGEARVTQGATSVTARDGQIIAFDSSQAYTLAMDQQFRMVAVRFAHRLVGLTPRETSSMLAAEWSTRNGVSALLAPLLKGIATHLAEFDSTAAHRLGDSVSSLITALFAERLRGTAVDTSIARRTFLLRVQSFAKEHLADPDLSPATLAGHHNVSLRYLQLLFHEDDTSPARWIRDERLARCYEDITNPRFRHLTIANIGERWGLYGASHFTRLFRERYHVTPRDLRRQLQGDMFKAVV